MTIHADGVSMRGAGAYCLRGPDGAVKQEGLLLVPGLVLAEGRFANLVTDVGDQYYATQGITGVAPANAAAPGDVHGWPGGELSGRLHDIAVRDVPGQPRRARVRRSQPTGDVTTVAG